MNTVITGWTLSPPGALRRRVNAPLAAMLALGLAAGAALAAPVVSYTATDVADVNLGEDLWRYDYTIGGSAEMSGTLNLLFDPGLYANLASSATAPELLLLGDVQPDAGAPADGIVTAILLSDLSPPATWSLSVDFTWLGQAGTKPGSQPFEYFLANGDPGAGGRTIAPGGGGGGTVPEPPMLPAMLAVAGLATWLQRRRAAARG